MPDDDNQESSNRERIAALEADRLTDKTADKLAALGAVQDRHSDLIVTVIERTDNTEEKVYYLAQKLQEQVLKTEDLEREVAESRAAANKASELLEISLSLIKDLKDNKVADLLERLRTVAADSAAAAPIAEMRSALQAISISLGRLTSPAGTLTSEVRKEFDRDFARFQKARLGIEFLVPEETYDVLTRMASLAAKAYRRRISGGGDNIDNWTRADEMFDEFTDLRESAVKLLHDGRPPPN